MIKNLPASSGDSGSTPGQGIKIPHVLEQLSPWATITEGHMCSRAHTLQQEKQPQWEALELQLESSSCLPQLEKSRSAVTACALQQRHRAARKNNFIFKNTYIWKEGIET